MTWDNKSHKETREEVLENKEQDQMVTWKFYSSSAMAITKQKLA